MHTQVADSKLLKILAKIAGQLTDLKDVITITEPCARKPQPRPSVAATLICYPLARRICLLLHRPVPERGQPHVFRSADAAQQLTAAGINIHVMDALKADGAKAPTAPTKVETTSPAVLMYTSGTTGNPKGVLISHKVAPPAAPSRARGCEPRCPRCA